MLRIHASRSAAEAKSYYTQSFSREDYYSQGQEIVGRWGGKGAARLGLSGRVDRESFTALCDNLHPHPVNPLEPQRLTARTKANRTVGYDFNFNCPKSVSLLYAFSKDGRILDALTEVVNHVMDRVETDIQTRIRAGGVKEGNRITGNLVRADFTHLTARPVDGLPDPHLHVHSYVFNSTFDEVENQWKAAQFRDLKAAGPYYQSIFHNELARRLQLLGYSIERRDMAFEVVGIPNSANHKFSRRTESIKKTQEELGISDPRKLDQLGAATRENKVGDISNDELHRYWLSRLTPGEQKAIQQTIEQGRQTLAQSRSSNRLGERSAAVVSSLPRLTGPITEIEEMALQYAILHCYTRESVVEERTLLGAALHYGVGQVEEERLRGFVLSRPEFVRREVEGRMMVTTRGVLAEEQAIVAWAQAGRGAVPALTPGYELEREILLPGRTTPLRLSNEQYNAAMHVLSSPDRMIGVRGLSGTGKTTLLHAVVRALEDRHHQMILMTVTSTAARDELPKDGFKNTQTVAAVLANASLRESFKGGVWLVDEAGMLSGRDLYRLIQAAEECHARLVVMGDPNQHEPIDRGNALRILEKEAGIPMVRVQTIQRQRDPRYREVVQLFADQRVVEGFEKLDAMGKIMAPGDEERYKLAAGYYMQAIREKKSIAVISPTHKEGGWVTEAIREELRKAGKIKHERIIPVLRSIDMVEAAQRDARSYHPGWAVEMVQNTQGFRAGERLRVVASSEHPQGGVLVERQDGSRAMLPVHECGARLKVFEWQGLQVGQGEHVRITRNGWSADHKLHLRSGTLRVIKGFTPEGQMMLDNGARLPVDFAHITHGYVSTSMASQGKTVDRVLTVQSAGSFNASSMQQAYVCVGRGREECLWLTDDKQELLEAVLFNGQRVSAMETVPDTPKLDYAQAVQLREAQERALARIGHASKTPSRHVPVPAGTDPPAERLQQKLGGQREVAHEEHQQQALVQSKKTDHRALSPALQEKHDGHLAEQLKMMVHRQRQSMELQRQTREVSVKRREKTREREMEMGE